MGDLFGTNGELMIGKITTPTFRKKKEIEKKQKQRAQTAISSKTWDYDELFGNNADGEMVIGAIKTPKYKKTKKEKREKNVSKTPEVAPTMKTEKSQHDYSSTFDLSGLLGPDFDLNIDTKTDDQFADNYMIPESEEQSYYSSDCDSSYTHSSEY